MCCSHFFPFNSSFSVLTIHNYSLIFHHTSFLFPTLPSLPSAFYLSSLSGSLIKAQLSCHSVLKSFPSVPRPPNSIFSSLVQSCACSTLHPRRLISFTLVLALLCLDHLTIKLYGHRNSISKHIFKKLNIKHKAQLLFDSLPHPIRIPTLIFGGIHCYPFEMFSFRLFAITFVCALLLISSTFYLP